MATRDLSFEIEGIKYWSREHRQIWACLMYEDTSTVTMRTMPNVYFSSSQDGCTWSGGFDGVRGAGAHAEAMLPAALAMVASSSGWPRAKAHREAG